MNLQTLSDDQLHTSTLSVASREREATITLLKHLAEVDRRHLFSKFKCDSLHAYCVDYLKMSDPQAGRRVSASRLLTELPTIEEKVLAGSMTLTSVCQANTFFRKEAAKGNKLIQKEKLELMNQLEGQASRKVEQILLSKSDQPEIHLCETVKQKTARLTEIRLLVDEETLNKLNRLKEIHSHEMPNATFAQIVMKLAEIGLEKLDPDLKAKRAQDRKAGATPAPERIKKPSDVNRDPSVDKDPYRLMHNRSRYIPAAVRHAVWMRDKGRCTFVDLQSGECCESRKFVEYDHIISFAHGGDHTTQNLRLRCRAHNQRHAIETFGLDQASRYRQVESGKRNLPVPSRPIQNTQ